MNVTFHRHFMSETVVFIVRTLFMINDFFFLKGKTMAYRRVRCSNMMED